mgnify:CR=1 FL=1
MAVDAGHAEARWQSCARSAPRGHLPHRQSLPKPAHASPRHAALGPPQTALPRTGRSAGPRSRAALGEAGTWPTQGKPACHYPHHHASPACTHSARQHPAAAGTRHPSCALARTGHCTQEICDEARRVVGGSPTGLLAPPMPGDATDVAGCCTSLGYDFGQPLPSPDLDMSPSPGLSPGRCPFGMKGDGREDRPPTGGH